VSRELSEDGALFDGRFDDGGPFRDTPEPGGISLESALRDFGPAALDDLIPRVRALAEYLDAAHRAGAVHGALHPSKVIVFDQATSLIKGTRAIPPYAAPEVEEGEAPTSRSDQYSLAAIAYEWLFGRPIDGPARRSVDVRTMPGVDRAVLSKAFTRALSPEPGDRFGTCSEFCDALAAATTPELPLLAFDAGDEADNIDPVGPFIPESPAPNVDDVKIVAEETNLTASQPDLDAIDVAVPFDSDHDDAFLGQGKSIEPSAVSSWNPPAAVSAKQRAQFGGTALILAAVVGAVFGFAAGYMARPRALQSRPAETFAVPPGTENAVASAEKPAPKAPTTKSPEAASAPQALQKPAAKAGRLLVRSSPSGATVSVDGVEKGVTPLALRDLEFGTRSVTIARSGYVAESRRVPITAARPSRSLDVRLFAASKPPAPKGRDATPRPGTPATLGKSAAATGGLNIDSRPVGAAVTINGKARGKTPLAINDLPPGDYQILMTMPGYRNYATTVRVVAGERVRAAASLTVQEQE
jgi:hypothetical protein